MKLIAYQNGDLRFMAKVTILFHLFGGNVPLLGSGARDSRDFSNDAHPAATSDGSRWGRPKNRSSSSSTQSRVLLDELGGGARPLARRLAEMGSAARGVVRC